MSEVKQGNAIAVVRNADQNGQAYKNKIHVFTIDNNKVRLVLACLYFQKLFMITT